LIDCFLGEFFRYACQCVNEATLLVAGVMDGDFLSCASLLIGYCRNQPRLNRECSAATDRVGGAEIAKPDNPAPYRNGRHRETSQVSTISPSLISPSHAVCYALMSRKTTELYVKVFQRVQQLVPQFAPTCAMADFEEASVAGFFIDNRLFQITVQTFSIIIATFPFANTYLCCWRCLLVN